MGWRFRWRVSPPRAPVRPRFGPHSSGEEILHGGQGSEETRETARSAFAGFIPREEARRRLEEEDARSEAAGGSRFIVLVDDATERTASLFLPTDAKRSANSAV